MWVCLCGYETEDAHSAMLHSVSHKPDHNFHSIVKAEGRIYVDGEMQLMYSPFEGAILELKIFGGSLGPEKLLEEYKKFLEK